MIKRNAAKPVRVVPPMMEKQETSTSTLQELLEKKKQSQTLYSAKEKKKESANLTRVSRIAHSGIRHSANVSSVLPN